MKTTLCLLTVLLSSGMLVSASELEARQLTLPNGPTITYFRPVEEKTTIALYTGHQRTTARAISRKEQFAQSSSIQVGNSARVDVRGSR